MLIFPISSVNVYQAGIPQSSPVSMPSVDSTESWHPDLGCQPPQQVPSGVVPASPACRRAMVGSHKKYQGDSEGSPRQRSCFLLSSCYLSSLSAWPLLKATKMPIELTKRWWWEQLMSGKNSQSLPIKANSSKQMKDLGPKSLEISWHAMANHVVCINPHCLPPGTCRKRGEP